MPRKAVVLDASVGAKWFREEPGTAEARELRSRHIRGDVVVAVDWLFVYEVLAVATRTATGPQTLERAWRDLKALDLAIVPPGDELVAAASWQRALLGCSLYDAFSAGLAELLHAELYSADERAHGCFPRVRLVGR